MLPVPRLTAVRGMLVCIGMKGGAREKKLRMGSDGLDTPFESMGKGRGA